MIVIVLPLVLDVVVLIALAFCVTQANTAIDKRIESKKIITTATEIVSRLIDAEFISLIYNAQKIPMLDIRFDEDARLTRDLASDLKKLCLDTPEHKQKTKQIEEQIDEILVRLRKIFTGDVEPDAHLLQFANTRQRTQKTYLGFTEPLITIDKFVSEEQRTQSQIQAREKQYRNYIKQVIVWGLVLNVILTVILAVYYSKNITQRIAVVRDNTVRLFKREPLAAPIGGNDEISQLDEVFHATASDLANVDRQRKHLVSLVREELSEPLRHVQYTLHNLSQGVYGDLTAKAESRLVLAARDTDRVMRLIDDLLSIETMEGANFQLDLKPTTSALLINTAADSVRDMADRHNVSLEIKGPPAAFIADIDRLIQVLINFLSNAIKYSPHGGIITIEVATTDGTVEFKVIDRGRGIPADKMEEIFQPFQQVDAATDQTVKGGTGLGLPISKTIVEQHGGSIGVISEDGQGSTFWFKIPKQ